MSLDLASIDEIGHNGIRRFRSGYTNDQDLGWWNHGLVSAREGMRGAIVTFGADTRTGAAVVLHVAPSPGRLCFRGGS